MILVHDEDPKLAAAIAAALEVVGHQVRKVESFSAVRDEAARSGAAAIVFALDQGSLAAFGELRDAFDPDVPVVATGTRSLLYRAFRRLQKIAPASARRRQVAPGRFWFVEQPVAPEAVRDAVATAIREASGSPPPPAARRMRVAELALIAASIAMAAGLLLWALGQPHDHLLRGGFTLFFAALAVERGSGISAARRVRLRPPWWAFAELGLWALLAAAQVASLAWPG